MPNKETKKQNHFHSWHIKIKYTNTCWGNYQTLYNKHKNCTNTFLINNHTNSIILMEENLLLFCVIAMVLNIHCTWLKLGSFKSAQVTWFSIRHVRSVRSCTDEGQNRLVPLDFMLSFMAWSNTLLLSLTLTSDNHNFETYNGWYHIVQCKWTRKWSEQHKGGIFNFQKIHLLKA